jgi:predicted nuclease of predicted toxin-antitoxin system
MKLLLDQGLPRSAVDLLALAGIDAVHVGDTGNAGATDESILQLGRDADRIVVTMDADFHAILATTGASKPSVIRIRIEGLKGEGLAKLLAATINQCAIDLEKGAAVTVQEGRVRLRHLPILVEY